MEKANRIDAVSGLVCVIIGFVASLVVAIGDLHSKSTLLLSVVAIVSALVLLADSFVWIKSLRGASDHAEHAAHSSGVRA
ncbi:MAG: hypothetical protein IIT89_01870 [Aeriscardovia sp.]|nr:hypothetical protein [Aeriscardovia sp.]